MANMDGTQTMTLESPLYVGGTRVDLQQLVRELEADGFTVVSTTTTPPDDGSDVGARFRIVATYPSAWMLSGWQKGRA
jgi:hypothetical protein